MASVEQFFEVNPTPDVLKEYAENIKSFIQTQLERGSRIALVTSGGTTVPLERNTVRYLDNFSEGRRGSSSAEEFVAAGYSVVFLHRKHSLQPYTRRFMTKARNFLDHLCLSEGEHISVVPQYEEQVKAVFEEYNSAMSETKLLCIPYISVTDYLFFLKEISTAMRPIGKKGLVYLAAAVSDFYIPFDKLVEHKIQSKDNENGLNLHLEPIPKMLGTLTNEWAPDAFVISFKLETKDDLLEPKALGSLKSYNQNLVVGNLLRNHQDQVILYSKDKPSVTISRTEEEKTGRIDIETRFIPAITDAHSKYME
mmetsp:Transcript_6244/g.10382  ORF Transcript_6244/g.10382 Transcript_6244/m.10382 type:complete len:310 (+) Transcript_6244:79-1008(+)